MIVSLRTVINTTLFWILIFFGFWVYTKYDPTPAKELLHFVGWDQLGNITVVNGSTTTTPIVESLSNQLIAERLSNIEQLCARSIRLPIYEQSSLQQPILYPSTPMNPITEPTSIIPSSAMTSGTSTIRTIENNMLKATSGSLRF